MARWQRHAGARRRTQKLRAGLTEGSIVYGEIVETERVLTETSQNKNRAPTRLSLRLAERGRLCFFPVETTRDVRAGEVVQARLLKKGEVFYAQALKSLGHFDGNVSFLSALSLQQLSVRIEFPSDVLSEAASLEGYVYAGEREDMRTLDFVTIDGEQARDFDDAVHAEEHEQGGWLVRVAIADVAHYVRCGSRLDEEARLRGNSRYLADRVVPMLPPRLSEDLCSLRAGEDRPCVMAEMAVDACGRLLHTRLARVAMRVRTRLTYGGVQEILDKHGCYEETQEETRGNTRGNTQGEAQEETRGETEQAVLRLYGAWRALARGRRERGALDIVREEHGVRLERDDKGALQGALRCVGVSASMASTAHRLIEDTMILANVAVAEHGSKAGAGFVVRAHEPPSLEKWQGLERDLAVLGLSSLLEVDGGRAKAGEAEGLRSRLRSVLAGVARREGHVSFSASEAILRAQSQARYVRGGEGSGKGGGEHFALALGCYCHFTSPIRRYADLCVHRALLELLGLEASVPSLPSVSSVSSSLCEGLVENERSAILLERLVFQRTVCACLDAREEGRREVFDGLVIKVMGFGFFVRLTRWGIEGVVMRGAFVRYRYRRAREEVEVEGVRLAFGSRVRVRVKESDAVSGRLELELESSLSSSSASSLPAEAC